MDKPERSLTTSSIHPHEDLYRIMTRTADVVPRKIIYWKYGKFETIGNKDTVTIDREKALRETEKLLWEHKESIGFSNSRTVDAIHITRVKEDVWLVEVPIIAKRKEDRGPWHAVTDTRRIMDVIKMFFDELEWFGMLDFKKIPVDSD